MHFTMFDNLRKQIQLVFEEEKMFVIGNPGFLLVCLLVSLQIHKNGVPSQEDTPKWTFWKFEVPVQVEWKISRQVFEEPKGQLRLVELGPPVVPFLTQLFWLGAFPY